MSHFFSVTYAVLRFFFHKKFPLIKYVADYYGYGMVLLTTGIFLNFGLPDLGIGGIAYVTLFTFLSGLAVLLYKWFWKQYLNAFTIFVSAILAAYIATIWSMETVLVVFAFLCIYDVIAVFKTKFMKSMILTVLQAKTVPPMFLTDINLSEMIRKLTKQKNKKKSTKPKKVKGHMLGNGDVILASCFAIASFAYLNSIVAGIIILICGSIGIWLNFTIVAKRSVGLPALPLIFASQIGIFIAFISLPVGIVLTISLLIITYFFIDKMAIRQALKKDKLENISK